MLSSRFVEIWIDHFLVESKGYGHSQGQTDLMHTLTSLLMKCVAFTDIEKCSVAPMEVLHEISYKR